MTTPSSTQSTIQLPPHPNFYKYSDVATVPAFYSEVIEPLIAAINGHSPVMVGYTSPSGAAYIYSYPYGRLRCIRRLWIETAGGGVKRNEQRMVAQTTKNTFNGKYTELLQQRGGDAKLTVVDHETLLKQLSDPQVWNKPHYSTYTRLMYLYRNSEQHIVNGGINGISPAELLYTKTMFWDWLLLSKDVSNLTDTFQALNAYKYRFRQMEYVLRRHKTYADWFAAWDSLLNTEQNPNQFTADMREILGALGMTAIDGPSLSQ